MQHKSFLLYFYVYNLSQQQLGELMDLKEYQAAAIKTESIVEKLEFNKEFVVSLFKLFVLSAEALDAVKKEVYYKNPKKANEQIIPLLSKLELELRKAKYAFSNKDTHNDVALNPRLFHGILGISTEAGELLDVLVKNLESNTPIDSVNVSEECHGDIGWYTAIITDALDLDWEAGLEKNIAKLKARYPNKFTVEDATNRDLDKERAILEGTAQ